MDATPRAALLQRPYPHWSSSVARLKLLYNRVAGCSFEPGSHLFGSPRFDVVTRFWVKGKKMEKLAQNIQEAFLNSARKERIFLTIYLMSGVKLSGRIKSFDKYSVVLESNNQEQLIFKHAISTVVVARPTHGAPPMHTSAAGAGSSTPGHPIQVGSPEHSES